MHDLGLLTRNVAIAHSVWVADEDMRLMGEAGCSIAHNAVSNLKLGSGVAPLRRLMEAGVNVALGTDGASSNDTLRIFDVMRVAALLHSATGPDFSRWLAATDILRAATLGGAYAAMLEHETGSLEVGKRADLIMLRTDTLPFTPMNDLCKHLVFAENGSSLELVMVNGTILVRESKLTQIDEDEIFVKSAKPSRPILPRIRRSRTAIARSSPIWRRFTAARRCATLASIATRGICRHGAA